MAVEHDFLKRTAVSDSSLGNGRYATLGTEEPNGLLISVDMDLEQATSASSFRGGVLCRYVDTANNLMLVKTEAVGYGIAGHEGTTFWRLIKRIGGSDTILVEGKFGTRAAGPRLFVGRDGICRVFTNGNLLTPDYETAPDVQLIAGGTLGKGKYGLIDAYTSATAKTRTYRRFEVVTAASDPVLFASLEARLTHLGHFRRTADNKAWAEIYRPGSDLPRIPVSGPELRPVEIGIRPSRGDFGTLPDAGLDKMKATPSYRPCWSYIPDK